jgi:hypothetical protein
MSKPASEHENAIWDRAQRMWREDGSPKGRLEEYVERARELQAMIDNPTAGQLPNPMVTHHGVVPPAEPIEEAEIQANLGEFPALTDQGDRLETPMTRKQEREASKRGQ